MTDDNIVAFPRKGPMLPMEMPRVCDACEFPFAHAACSFIIADLQRIIVDLRAELTEATRD